MKNIQDELVKELKAGMVVILACNVMKRLGEGGSCIVTRLRPEETAGETLYCHSKNNQYVGIWTLVTGMKMRFCERHIRVNRQERGCGRKDETTTLRQFAEESEIANNCLKLSV